MLCAVSTTERNSSINVEETVKDFVATRPRRPHRGRIIAGVAAGIGRRYGIDPVIVRVALVVSAFYGGAGVIVYLLGWLFLAADDDEVSGFEGMIGRGRSSMSRGFAILLCIALFPAGEFVFLGGHYSTLAGMLALLGGLFLLHRYRSTAGIVTDSTGTVTPGTNTEVGPMTDSTPTSALHPDGSESDGPQDRVPPAWDPLGAAPFAWDLPDPTVTQPVTPQPVVEPERRRRSRIGLATFGLALVVGAVLGLVAPDGGWLTVPHIIGILGGVVGIGLVAGSFVRGGRGLIPLALLLSAAGFLMTSAHITNWRGVGDARYTPTSIGDVKPLYERSVGTLRLDLTELPNNGRVETTVKLGLGDARIDVPPGADVTATCSASIGDVTCLGQRESGAHDPSVTVHRAASGSGDHLTIVLHVEGGTGSFSVVSGELSAVPAPPGAPDVPAAPSH